MNERIFELAKQAGLKKEHASDREYIGDFDWRQFGELIVQECILAVDKTDTRHVYTTFQQGLVLETIKNSKAAIRDHFGVK